MGSEDAELDKILCYRLRGIAAMRNENEMLEKASMKVLRVVSEHQDKHVTFSSAHPVAIAEHLNLRH